MNARIFGCCAAWALALLLVLAPRAAAAAEAVRLLPSGPGSVRFTVEVPEPELLPLAEDPNLLELRLAGYEVDARPGDPALVVRVIAVAVPPEGAVEVGAVGSATEWRERVRLAHLPWFERGEERLGLDSPRALAMARGPETTARTALRPRPLARLLGVAWLRDQRIARVAIAPAAYDPASGRLTLHRRVDVELRIGGASPGAGAVGRADAFEPVYRGALVNYEQGRAWRRAPASPAQATPVPDSSIYAGRRWVKIAVTKAGFYRVDFGQVRNSALFEGSTNVPSDSLRLFVWPGVPVLPEESYCDSCDYREVAIGVVDDGDRVFDDNTRDYFYFFALGPSDWVDHYAGPGDPALPDSVFLNHPYETRNYYYLTVARADPALPGPFRRIATEPAAPGDTTGATTPATFTARAHFEQDREYWPDATPIVGFNPDGSYMRTLEFWEKWFWASITRTAPQFEEPFDLPGMEPAEPARVRLRVWGLTSLIPGFSKGPDVFDHYLDVGVGALAFPRRAWDGANPQTFDSTVTGLAATDNRIRAEVFTDPDPTFASRRVDDVAVAWFDVFYARRFEPVANELAFDSDPAGGDRVYRIGPFNVMGPDSIPRVFDVTDPLAPIEIVGAEFLPVGPDQYRMRFQRAESGRRRYRIVPDWSGGSRIVKPPNQDVVDAPNSSLENLRRGRAADYLLIYYDGFRAAADSLLPWRREHLPMPSSAAPYDTMSVPVSALFDQFSGGRTDPSAIRNFLRAAFFNWSKRPTFVTFLGDASSDFKNLTGTVPAGQPGSLVPSWEGGFDLIVNRNYATDDWMLNVDDPIQVVPDFYGGRIPAGDAASALSYARGKLIHYERAAPLGEWRNRVMLIADDNQKGAEPDFPIFWGHLRQTVDLDVQAMPPETDRAYVYLHTYPDGPSDTKPGAKADILKNLDQGVVMANYIGHGSPFKIADESVFLDSDADLLTNRDRPTVFVTASCDVGKYNNPTVKSLGERMLLNPAGGAVAVISSTELALSNINARLNLDLYRELFRREASTGLYEVPLAQGLLVAKTGGVNNQKYQVMGDAAVRLALPRLAVAVTLEGLDGIPVSEVRRGQTLRLRGQVLDRPGGSPVSLDGLAHLLLEDSAPVDTTPDCLGGCEAYPFRASPIFRGDVSVVGGQFQTRFVTPLDGRLGPRGRARAYVELGSGTSLTDAAGSAAFPVDTSGALPTDDREGPAIMLSFVGGSTEVRPDAVLRVDLFDRSGILITGNAPQNGIIVTLDDNSSQRHDITPSFRYAANSHQSGTAFFRLPGLAAGPHRVSVSAADNLAAGITAAEHRSSAALEFQVTAEPVLRVTRAFLFPNPIRSGGSGSGGQFVVDAPGDSVNVLVKIYTVSGRLIRTLRSDGGLVQVQLRWDGLDAEGAALARGVYLFKAQVFPRLPGGGSGSRQRADAEGRFVVIGR